jgi:hypothetical protein
VLKTRVQRWVVRRFVTWVRETPTRELETLDGRRARIVVAGLLRASPYAVDRRRIARLKTTVEWRVTEYDGGASTHTMVFADGRLRVRRGVVATPDLTVVIDVADLLRLAAGVESGMALFMQGRLRLDGDPTVALRLGRVFRTPR